MRRSFLFAAFIPAIALAQSPPTSGVRPQRLLIRNATIVDGNGTPAKGPFDITVVGNTIVALTPRDPVATGGRGGGRGARGLIAAPKMLIYPQFGRPTNADSARARVRALKAQGVDGIKLLGIDRDIMQAMEEEAKAQGLRIAHHVGVEETNAWDDIHFGTTSIEHWYGIPDAAIKDGVQGFPSYYNYNNETDRFRWAGHLWREADPERLDLVLDSMA